MQKNPAKAITIQCCGSFTPPKGCVSTILAALSWIPAEDLEGIGSMFLFEHMPPLTPGSNPDLERSIQEGLSLFAAYNGNGKGEPAHIILVLPNLYKPIPRFLHRSPALTLWFTENIAHEVAHHVIAEKRYALRATPPAARVQSEEEFAELYAESLVAKMTSARVNQLGNLLLKIAAEVNYYKGVYFWTKQKYQAAAECFYLAIQVRRNHRKAAYWFWKSEERAKNQL